MSDEQQPRTPPGIPWGISVWLAVLILWVTRIPFLSRDGPWELVLTPPTGILQIAGNFLLLAPLAFVAGRSVAARFERRPPVAVLSLGLLAACLFVEAGQIFVQGRVVSPYDFALNLSGGGMGLWAGVRVTEAGPRVRRMTSRTLLAVVGAAYLGVLGYLGSRVSEARAGLRLRGWDESFAVRVAEEVGGIRAYQGEVGRAHICAGSTRDTVCVSHGASEAERRRLVGTVEESQSLSVTAHVRSASSRQYGPTRIVTFSDGPGRRNVTLGQSGDDLVLRLRTPPGGPNGTGFTFSLEDAVPVGQRVTVNLRVRESTVRLQAETGRQVRTVEYAVTPEWRLAWLVAGRADPAHPGQLWWAAVLGSLLALLPPGMAAGWSLGQKGLTHALVGGAAGAVLISSPVALFVASGLGPEWIPAVVALGAVAGWAGDRDRGVWFGRHTADRGFGSRN